MAVSEDGAPVIDPMKQFEIKSLFGGGEVGSFLTITNSTLWMGVAILATAALLIGGMRGRAPVPSRMQSVAELIYSFIRSMVMDVLHDKDFRNSVNMRSDHAARAAPACPEVDQDGGIGLQHFLIEVAVSEFESVRTCHLSSSDWVSIVYVWFDADLGAGVQEK